MSSLKRIEIVIVIAIIFLLGGGAYWFLRKPKLTSQRDRMSYTMGHQIGENIKREGIELNVTALSRAIEDVLQNRQLALTPEEMRDVVLMMQTELQKKLETEAAANLQKGQEFMQANANRPGVKSTSEGLQYEAVKQGAGKSPKADSTVTIKYTGKLISGEVFDTTDNLASPLEVKMSQVFPGLRHGLSLMHEGASYKLYIPASLAYGSSPRPGIPPQSVLVYEVELVKVK